MGDGEPVGEYTGLAAEQFLDRTDPSHRLTGVVDGSVHCLRCKWSGWPDEVPDHCPPRRAVSAPARVHLAWLMWCYQEGYRTVEDRAIMENWMGEHQDNAEDEATRQILLTMADEVLDALEAEQEVRSDDGIIE